MEVVHRRTDEFLDIAAESSHGCGVGDSEYGGGGLEDAGDFVARTVYQEFFMVGPDGGVVTGEGRVKERRLPPLSAISEKCTATASQ